MGRVGLETLPLANVGESALGLAVLVEPLSIEGTSEVVEPECVAVSPYLANEDTPSCCSRECGSSWDSAEDEAEFSESVVTATGRSPFLASFSDWASCCGSSSPWEKRTARGETSLAMVRLRVWPVLRWGQGWWLAWLRWINGQKVSRGGEEEKTQSKVARIWCSQMNLYRGINISSLEEIELSRYSAISMGYYCSLKLKLSLFGTEYQAAGK